METLRGLANAPFVSLGCFSLQRCTHAKSLVGSDSYRKKQPHYHELLKEIIETDMLSEIASFLAMTHAHKTNFYDKIFIFLMKSL
jgi:hypothetical protein